MKRLPIFMARHRLTWLLWLTAWTPLVMASFALQVAWDAVKHIYALWNWQYRHEWRAWFQSFTEKHRKAQRSLALKPPPRGVVWVSEPPHDIQ